MESFWSPLSEDLSAFLEDEGISKEAKKIIMKCFARVVVTQNLREEESFQELLLELYQEGEVSEFVVDCIVSIVT